MYDSGKQWKKNQKKTAKKVQCGKTEEFRRVDFFFLLKWLEERDMFYLCEKFPSENDVKVQ